jgi:hypothetical protein
VLRNNYPTIKDQFFVIDEGESLCGVKKVESSVGREKEFT